MLKMALVLGLAVLLTAAAAPAMAAPDLPELRINPVVTVDVVASLAGACVSASAAGGAVAVAECVPPPLP